MVLVGLREEEWGAQGGGGKLWLVGRPPFSRGRRGGEGEEQQRWAGLSCSSRTSSCRWRSV